MLDVVSDDELGRTVNTAVICVLSRNHFQHAKMVEFSIAFNIA